MQLAGGATDKFGNLYEGKWTVYCLLNLLNDKIETLRLEPPREDGCEFYVTKGNKKTFYQVKTGSSWTLGKLNGEGVLRYFFDKLSNPDYECAFVSIDNATTLQKLAWRAFSAQNYDEFSNVFLEDQASTRDFEQLSGYFKDVYEKEELFERLKRIKVESSSKHLMDENLSDRVKLFFADNPDNIRDALAQFALENIHQELSGHDIWTFCRDIRGFITRDWGRDPHVFQAVEEATNQFTYGLRETLILGMRIPRSECDEVDRLLAKNQVMLVSGTAGVGKSNVLGEVVRRYKDKKWPVLALRLDRIDPAATSDTAWSQLGLPGSPVQILGSISKGRDCLLIIDQLDAISLASGRSLHFFERIRELLRQAGSYPNLKIIFGCRQYDIEYDDNIRKLATGNNQVAVQPLPRSDVEKVLTKLTVDTQRIQEEQWKLFALPVHLSMFADIVAAEEPGILEVMTAKQLFDSYWKTKERILMGLAWQPLVGKLCDYMSEKQILSAPEIFLDEYSSIASKMASENVLVHQNGRYSFFHEAFFDYAFARQFVARDKDLIQLLQKEGQGLFRRAQVRQVLHFLRTFDQEAYVQTLENLLASPSIRFHLKEVVFGFLGTLQDPTEQEWEVISKYFHGSHSKGTLQNARAVLRRSSGWFGLLDSQKLIERWLESSELTERQEAELLLRVHHEHYPDRVTAILEPYLVEPEKNADLLRSVFSYADFGASRSFFELGLRLLDLGIFDHDQWSMHSFEKLAKKNPEWACEIIHRYLRRSLQQTDSKSNDNRDSIKGLLEEAAQNVPAIFLDAVLVPIIETVESTATERYSPDGPLYDPIWSVPTNWEYSGFMNTLLCHVASAIKELASTDPAKADKIFLQLEGKDCHTLLYILYQGYQGNPTRYAGRAADYLLSNLNHLQVGNISNLHQSSADLISTIAPFLPSDKLAAISQALLEYYPEDERSTGTISSGAIYPSRFGLCQYRLLDAIPEGLRSPAVAKRLGEWGRKFHPEALSPSDGIRGGMVTSPIPLEATVRMSDRQWLKATEKYDTEERPYRLKNPLMGGSLELARALGERTKENPVRFANLLLQMPDYTQYYYISETIRGIKDSPIEIDLDLLIQVVMRVYSLPSRPAGSEVCDLISRYSAKEIPDTLLNIVAWYSTEDPDPERESWNTEAGSGRFYYNGDILTAGLNCVRGRACDAMGDLIWEQKERIEYFLPTIQKVLNDSSLSVKAFAAKILLMVMRHDVSLALDLSGPIVSADERLLETRFASQLLSHLAYRRFELAKPAIEGMLKFEKPEVREAGGILATQACMFHNDDGLFEKDLLQNDAVVRKGVAQVAASTLKTEEYAVVCSKKLAILFFDGDKDVRAAASHCFRSLPAEKFPKHKELINIFLASPSFRENYANIIYGLDELEGQIPDVACDILEKFIRLFRENDEQSGGTASTSMTASEMLVRLYSRSRDPGIKERSLNLFDSLLEKGYYTGSAMKKVERLF